MKAIENGFVLENTRKMRKNKTKSKKWDNCLVDYKNYFKEYRKCYKNSKKGDQVALALYPYMKAKWEVLKKRIIKAKISKCLTEKQIERMSRINTKIAKSWFL